jgi:glycosyltransferase involved in cell wall biosynthesis
MYFVDARKKDLLSRPEHHFPDIRYPYPPWIVEMVLPSQMLLPLFPRLFAALYQWRIGRMTKRKVGCVVLNGFFTSLAPYLTVCKRMVALSHGSDLDLWASTRNAEVLSRSFTNRSIFKYFPSIVARRMIKFVLMRQYSGYTKSDTVVYFPIGFNVEGDHVVRQLIDRGVRYAPRYDISFEPLRGQPRGFKHPSEKLELFSGVRFLFKTLPDGNAGYSKGNDLIIEGIAKYFSRNPNIRVHFVEKGEDVRYAKEYCNRLGLEKVVVWHKEMPFRELLALYQISDICFDQLGKHWIGAIGGYALWLGKPLIANPECAVRSGVWPVDNPVCAARTAEDICEWLTKLERPELRRELSEASQEFAERYLTPMKTLDSVFGS